MYKVEWKDTLGRECAEMFDDLTQAINHGKLVNCFVTITGNEYEIVGWFGTDSVEDGLLPNGSEYTWKKRR